MVSMVVLVDLLLDYYSIGNNGNCMHGPENT